MAVGAEGATINGTHTAVKVINIVNGTGAKIRIGDVVWVNGAGGTANVVSLGNSTVLVDAALTAANADRLVVQETY